MSSSRPSPLEPLFGDWYGPEEFVEDGTPLRFVGEAVLKFPGDPLLLKFVGDPVVGDCETDALADCCIIEFEARLDWEA